MMKPPRPLGDDEIEQLLKHDVPAHLASLDADGFPRVTTLWFVWTSGAFYLTSIADRPHLRRLQCNPRAGICVDLEEPERADGSAPIAGSAQRGKQNCLSTTGRPGRRVSRRNTCAGRPRQRRSEPEEQCNAGAVHPHLSE